MFTAFLSAGEAHERWHPPASSGLLGVLEQRVLPSYPACSPRLLLMYPRLSQCSSTRFGVTSSSSWTSFRSLSISIFVRARLVRVVVARQDYVLERSSSQSRMQIQGKLQTDEHFDYAREYVDPRPPRRQTIHKTSPTMKSRITRPSRALLRRLLP